MMTSLCESAKSAEHKRTEKEARFTMISKAAVHGFDDDVDDGIIDR